MLIFRVIDFDLELFNLNQSKASLRIDKILLTEILPSSSIQ